MEFSDASPIAVGSTHTISVGFPDEWGEEPPLRDFRVVSTDPSVLRVLEVRGSTIELEGRSAGEVYLRVLDARSTEERLLDRVRFRVDNAARVVARPSYLPLPTVFHGPMVLHTDLGRVELTPLVLAADGTSLVAEGTELRVPAPDEAVPLVAGEPVQWEVAALGETHTGAINVVDAVDELRVMDLREDFEGSWLEPVSDLGTCLVPHASGLPVFGALVEANIVGRTETSERAGLWLCPSKTGRARWDVRVSGLQRSYWVDFDGEQATFTPIEP